MRVAKRVLGAALLAGPFIFIVGMIAVTDGIGVAAGAFAFSFGFAALIALGAWLVTG